MRRFFVLMLVAALVAAVVGITGCGTDNTPQAKTYMTEGDALSAKVTIFTGESALDAAGVLAKLGIQYSKDGTVEPSTVTDAGKQQIKKLVAQGEAAKAEYEKILSLDDVELYKEYVELRIKAIDETILVLNSLNSLLDDIAAAPAGTSVTSVMTDWATSNASAAVSAIKAYSDSQDAKAVKVKIAAQEKKK